MWQGRNSVSPIWRAIRIGWRASPFPSRNLLRGQLLHVALVGAECSYKIEFGLKYSYLDDYASQPSLDDQAMCRMLFFTACGLPALPKANNKLPHSLLRLVQGCWLEEPSARPHAERLHAVINSLALTPVTNSLFPRLIRRLGWIVAYEYFAPAFRSFNMEASRRISQTSDVARAQYSLLLVNQKFAIVSILSDPALRCRAHYRFQPAIEHAFRTKNQCSCHTFRYSRKPQKLTGVLAYFYGSSSQTGIRADLAAYRHGRFGFPERALS